MVNQDSLNNINISIQDTIKVIDSGSVYSNPNFYLSVIIALIAFLGLFLPFIRASYKEHQRLRSLYAYVLYILKELIKPIEDKIESLETLKDNIKDIDCGNFAFKDSANLLVQVLLKIDHKDLHQIFIVNLKSDNEEKHKHFKNIIDAIDFFDKQNELDKRNFFQFFNDLRRYEKDFNESVDAILRSFDLFLSHNKKNNIKPSDDNFLKGFDMILNEWQKKDTRDSIKTINDEILVPLKKHCSDSSNDPRAIQTIPQIIKCNSAHLNITTLRKLYFNIFDETKKVLLSKKTNLEEAISFYK
jgi:hypothetical protein